MKDWILGWIPITIPLVHQYQILGNFCIFTVASLITYRSVAPALMAYSEKLGTEQSRNSRLRWTMMVMHAIYAALISIWDVYLLLAIPFPSDAEERVFGYSRPIATSMAFSAAYYLGSLVWLIWCRFFLWDLIFCLYNASVFGLGFVVHAAHSLVCAMCSLKPYTIYSACCFTLFASNAFFVVTGWFLRKVNDLYYHLVMPSLDMQKES